MGRPPIWFALDEERPFFAFAGIWTTWKGTRDPTAALSRRGFPFAPIAVQAGMQRFPYRGHRFPPDIIRHAVWLYLRFTLSLRDIEDLLAERGLDEAPCDGGQTSPECQLPRKPFLAT